MPLFKVIIKKLNKLQYFLSKIKIKKLLQDIGCKVVLTNTISVQNKVSVDQL